LFAAMRRALVLIALSLMAVAATAPGASASEWTDGVKFKLHTGGFDVSVESEVGGDEQKLLLSLYRHGELAIYEVPAEITSEEVKARFGSLGELDYTFTPARPPGPCDELFKGTYKGTFDFTGENDYVSIAADHAPGTLGPPKDCKGAGPRGRRAAAARPAVAEDEGPDADEATLTAATGHKLPADVLLAVQFEDERGRPRVFYTAYHEEKEEGMLIARGAQVAAAPRTFTWDLSAGTARVAPPAPFTGSATFKRRPGKRAIWRGSLRVPVLGEGPTRLTGSSFKASLTEGTPFD
jgi:hypothetical protein